MNNLGPFQINCSLMKIFPSAGFPVDPVNPAGTVNKNHSLATPGEAPEFIISTSNSKKQFAKYNPTENTDTSESLLRGCTLAQPSWTCSLWKKNEAKLPGTFKI